jgi:serine/threonine protein kinase
VKIMHKTNARQMSQVKPGALAGQSFGPYTLCELIGAGGMAEVYRAVRTGPLGFARMFAVKRIIGAAPGDSLFVQMFCTEARVSALLEHPNIVQVHDFGEVDGSYYLAMEYLKGATVIAALRALLARKLAFPVPTVAHVGRQVALGLAYAHALGGPDGQPLHLVHRDINPSNIMLLESGGVKILDFGVARAPSLAQHHTQAGYLKGKPSYSTPEQLKHRPFDGRSDVFSLGITLWEMLTMRRLFLGNTDFETITNVMKRPIPAPSKIRREVPANLDDIVMRALERDPEKRPDAREVADRLGEYLRGVYYLEDALVDLMHDLRDDPHICRAGSPAAPASAGAAPAASGALPAPPSVAVADSDVIADQEISVLDVEPTEAPHITLSAPPEPVAPRRRGGRNPIRRLRAAIIAAAIAGPGLVAAIHWGSAGRLGVAVGGGGLAYASTDEIVVEVNSRPSGATVERAEGGTLGTTPLVVKLPRGRAKVHLVLRKLGFEPMAYDVPPEHDSLATLDLALAAPAEGADPSGSLAPARHE